MLFHLFAGELEGGGAHRSRRGPPRRVSRQRRAIRSINAMLDLGCCLGREMSSTKGEPFNGCRPRRARRSPNTWMRPSTCSTPVRRWPARPSAPTGMPVPQHTGQELGRRPSRSRDDPIVCGQDAPAFRNRGGAQDAASLRPRPGKEPCTQSGPVISARARPVARMAHWPSDPHSLVARRALSAFGYPQSIQSRRIRLQRSPRPTGPVWSVTPASGRHPRRVPRR
jgi:hypothetical protein